MNSLLVANIACLGQGISLLRTITPETYNRKIPEVFNSSIGGHIRHNLDHYLAFVAGEPKGRIDYDARKRSEDIENDPVRAAAVMEELVAGLEAIRDTSVDRVLRVCMDDGGESVWTSSTFGRELQFLLSHTIHHYALVVAIAGQLGIREFPSGFGVAPSTLHYREQMTT